MIHAKAKFQAELEIIVKKKDKVKITLLEEWCTEKEMKDEHGWSTPLACT